MVGKLCLCLIMPKKKNSAIGVYIPHCAVLYLLTEGMKNQYGAVSKRGSLVSMKKVMPAVMRYALRHKQEPQFARLL